MLLTHTVDTSETKSWTDIRQTAQTTFCRINCRMSQLVYRLKNENLLTLMSCQTQRLLSLKHKLKYFNNLSFFLSIKLTFSRFQKVHKDITEKLPSVVQSPKRIRLMHKDLCILPVWNCPKSLECTLMAWS